MGIKIEFYSWESNIGFKNGNQNLKSNLGIKYRNQIWESNIESKPEIKYRIQIWESKPKIQTLDLGRYWSIKA